MMAKVLKVMVETSFANHLYKWGGTIRRQKEGWTTGLRTTGSLVRNNMDQLIDLFKMKLEELGLKVKLTAKYVDDIMVVVTNLP